MKPYEIVSQILTELASHVRPGITTLTLNNLAAVKIKEHGAYSYNKGYKPRWADMRYPYETCISVNDEIAHGIPSDRVLASGDIVNIDLGIVKDGECADAALSVPVGEISYQDKKLLKTTKKCLREAIKIIKDGVTVGEIAEVIEETAKRNGFVVNRQLCGHGIGKDMHIEPHIYQAKNWLFNNKEHYMEYQKLLDVKLQAGQRICIEPMITYNDRFGQRAQNTWTYKTRDGKKSAMFEHMMEVTKTGANVLTTHIEV